MKWLVDRFGIVRIRQIAEDLRHRLAFLPMLFVLIALVVSQLTLWIDEQLGNVDLPDPLETSVDSSRPVFATIAGGLITTVTLLLSMMLVAVQLASANFSPRTLRNWLGDVTLRRSIAIVVATIVYCLMGLRSVRTGPGAVDNPTVTVLIAVLLALVSLIAVIRAVDHVASNMQVGTVARRLVDATLHTLDDSRQAFANQPPVTRPADSRPLRGQAPMPRDAHVVETSTRGFVQQIDEQTLAEALPGGASAWVAVSHGDFVMRRAPLLRVDVDLDDAARHAVGQAFAIGETRTMQQDVGFGLAQLSDIAVRALSPGINDPETASGIVLNLGEVLRTVWSHEPVPSVLEHEGRTIHRHVPSQGEILLAALDPIRRHARNEPSVLATLARVIQTLWSETQRCELPGPTEPFAEFLDDLRTTADDSDWLDRERELLVELTAHPG